MNAKKIIKLEYGDSTNLITQEIIAYALVFDNEEISVATEISKGEGMNRVFNKPINWIYGVSVVVFFKKDIGEHKKNTTKRNNRLIKKFDSLELARLYNNTLSLYTPSEFLIFKEAFDA